MTKHIRVENADTSNHPVRVTTEDKQADGSWLATSSQQLDHPTAMSSSTYIHSHRRLVIEELPADAPAAPVAHQQV